MLALQPTMGFSLLGDFLPFRPFLTQFSPPSYSHRLDVFLIAFNPSFPWSSFDSPTHWLPFCYSSRHSPSIHPHHVSWPGHSSAFYKSYYICISYKFIHSWFFLILQIPFSSRIGPKIFHNIFRLNILNCCSFRLVNVQASHPYVTAVLINVFMYF